MLYARLSTPVRVCPPLPLLRSTLGPLPDFLLSGGKNALKYFQVQEDLLQDPLTGAASQSTHSALLKLGLLCPP
jgi:hypothetical protein